jgi:hypothetical protein
LKGKLRNSRKRWYGHTLRMNEEGISNKVLNTRVKEKRPRAHKTKLGTTD